jgi:hypothetical protein
MAIKIGCVLYVQLPSLLKSHFPRLGGDSPEQMKIVAPSLEMLVIYLN